MREYFDHVTKVTIDIDKEIWFSEGGMRGVTIRETTLHFLKLQYII